jgi:hypothetical protein
MESSAAAQSVAKKDIVFSVRIASATLAKTAC